MLFRILGYYLNNMIELQTNKGEFKNDYKVILSHELSSIYSGKFKVKFNHIPLEDPKNGFNSFSNYESIVNPGGWVTWRSGGSTRCDINIYTDKGDHILTRRWDSVIDGDDIEKAFSIFCSANPNCKGIIIGSHDGEWGHWVDAVRNKEVECLIIEGSDHQFKELYKNYSKYYNCTLINTIVSTDGKDVTWYTTKEGYSDSVVPGISEKFNPSYKVFNTTKPSTEINQIIEDYDYKDFDFLHLDLEGYDTNIIMALKYLPKLIVFENEHCKELGNYDDTIEYLKSKGYSIIERGIDTLASKL